MRYHYFYQTSENKSADDWISARDRNDAYTQLRKNGIKPYKLLGKNPLAWRRWAAIALLSCLVVILGAIVISDRELVEDTEDRAQLYGDPAVIQQLSANGWRRTFKNDGDAWFARHAIPASSCDCSNVTNVVLDAKHIQLSTDNPPELDKMVRMVNGMKDELSAFMNAGGSQEDYMTLCDERLIEERSIVEQYNRQFDVLRNRKDDIEADWENKNTVLRSMGLPTVAMPIEE